jgi:hypothetical protein
VRGKTGEGCKGKVIRLIGDLMADIRRFVFIKSKKGVWDCIKASDGPWMLHADHEAALAEKDQEIERLKKENREHKARLRGYTDFLILREHPQWLTLRDANDPIEVLAYQAQQKKEGQ